MNEHLTAFLGHERVGAGTRDDVTALAHKLRRRRGALLVFDDASGAQIDLDLRTTPERAEAGQPPADAAAARTPGRPKLGVVAREVTLLPRHWEWLSVQPGGASVALRKLVEEARRAHGKRDAARAAQERCYRFLHAIAGNLAGYEEALRALFGQRPDDFDAATADWPDDIRSYAQTLAHDALARD